MHQAEIEASLQRQQRIICDTATGLRWETARNRVSVSGRSIAATAPMAGFKKFEEIVAWQLSHQLKVRVDEFLARPDFKRKFKFADQLSDAVRSAPRNIAEGHMRGFKHKEFAQFLRIARGSLGEVLNHLLDAHEQHLITEDELMTSEWLAKRALKATTALIRYLEATPSPPPAPYERKKPPD